MELKLAETEKKRQKTLSEAEQQANNLIRNAEQRAASLIEEAEKQCEEKWSVFEQRANDLIVAHQALQNLMAGGHIV